MQDLPTELLLSIIDVSSIENIKKICSTNKRFNKICQQRRHNITKKFYDRSSVNKLKFLYTNNQDEYSLLYNLAVSSDELPTNSNNAQKSAGFIVYMNAEFLRKFDKENVGIWYLYHTIDLRLPSYLIGALKEFSKDYEITDILGLYPTITQEAMWKSLIK